MKTEINFFMILATCGWIVLFLYAIGFWPLMNDTAGTCMWTLGMSIVATGWEFLMHDCGMGRYRRNP